MIEIKAYHDLMRDDWDRYVRSHPLGTFFHLIGWRNVIKKSFGHRSCYLYAEENGAVKGVLPLFHIRSLLFGSSLISVPFGVYGGIIADDPDMERLLLERAKEMGRELQVGYIELRHTSENDIDLPAKDLYVTFTRELYDDLDENMKAIPRKQRRMIRQGEKHGLVSVVDNAHLKGFYNIYAHSVRNLGTPVFSYHYFRNLVDEFGQNCKVLTVWREDVMVAGVMTFFFMDAVLPYYGGALSDSFKYAVNDFMYWELMRYGCENGYGSFDFGRSKVGTGPYNFKRHWGFEPRPLPYQYYLVRNSEIPNLSPTNPRFSRFIKLWKRLPMPVTKLVGPKIVKYIP